MADNQRNQQQQADQGNGGSGSRAGSGVLQANLVGTGIQADGDREIVSGKDRSRYTVHMGAPAGIEGLEHAEKTSLAGFDF